MFHTRDSRDFGVMGTHLNWVCKRVGIIMYTFLLRFLLFISLWVLMIHNTRQHLIFSLMMLTVSLLVFFFLSNIDASIYFYGILTVVLLIHGIFIEEAIYTSLLLLLVVIIAIFRFTRKMQTYVLVSITFLSSLLLAVTQKENLFLWGIIGSVSAVLLIKLNEFTIKDRHNDEYIESLKAEYRQLKRMHISTEEMAKNEERTRIAREIHDSVGHQLTALIMKLEMLHIQKPNPEFAELKEMANESLEETRQAVQTLRETESSGITAVIQLIRKLEAESQLLIQFTLKEGVLSIPLSNVHGVVLDRVMQEALTNVMRHSDSKLVSISIGKSAIDTLTFTITNPVVRLEKFKSGFGLENMQSRVREIGGTINIYQTEEQFVVQGMVPYE